MASKSQSDTCCLTLPLKLEKWQIDRLEKRLEIARQIYNTLLRFELKKLRRFEEQPEVIAINNRLIELRQQDITPKKEISELFKQLEAMRKSAGFTEYDFKSDIGGFYKHFKDNIGSNVAMHGIAPQVWRAFDWLFHHNGKRVHFKKQGELDSICGYSKAGKSGGVEIYYRVTPSDPGNQGKKHSPSEYIEWKGLILPIKRNPSNEYESEMLERRVKYCRLIRRKGKTQSRWYVQLMIEGKPAVKYDKQTGTPKHQVGNGTVGIDIGPQTIAYSSENEVCLMELADQVVNIEHEKRIIQRKLDRSRRASNPQNYNEDGTIKRGIKLIWTKSKRYCILQQNLAYLQYQQSQTRKRQHTELANHLLTLGNRIIVEDMSWPALTHRAKETAISEKTGKYKRKSRFGKSVANKAPAMLIGILDQKLKSLGYAGVTKADTKKTRASQYNHLLNEYKQKKLSERWNIMPDGRRIQRDLYSAFLLQHLNDHCDGYNAEALNNDYEHFTYLHNQAILRLASSGKTIASMGIKRT